MLTASAPAQRRPLCPLGWLGCVLGALLTAVPLGPVQAQPAPPQSRLVALAVQPPSQARKAAPGQVATRTIRLESSARPVYTVIHMANPERLIVDLAHTELGDLAVPPLDPQDSWFEGLTAQQLDVPDARLARVVVTLRDGVSVDVGRDDRAILITARGPAAPVGPASLATALKRLESSPIARPEPTPPPAPVPAVAVAADRPRPAETLSVFNPLKAGAARPQPRPQLIGVLCTDARPDGENFSLNLTRPPAPEAIRQSRLSNPDRLVIDLQGAKLPPLKRQVSLDKRYVRQVRLAPHRGGVRVVFDLRNHPSQPTVEPSARGVSVALHGAPLTAARPALRMRAATPQTASLLQTALARSLPVGDLDRRITLDVRDADIINVLRLISEETGENIIASDEVKGKVTLHLRNVPADQALDTLLRTKGLDRVRTHNIIRVASAETIQKERDLDLARRRAALEVEETVIRMETVNYATASEIVDQLKPMLTGRGSIQVNARTNTLIVQDIPVNVERLVNLARRLDKQTPLVMIQARIVEANTSSMQDLGIQWGGSSQETSRTHNPTGLMFPGDVVINGSADNPANQVAGIATPARYAVNLPATLSGQGAGLGFILGSANGSQILNLRLSAMESNGNGKVISSPEVATLDNKTARVSQGVEIPVSVTSAAGVNTRFVPAVLELEVTPHVTNDGTVLLRIKTQKSEADFTNRGAAGDPTIQKRYAETEVLVRDGDTSVIGGIYTRNTGDTYNQVPFISQIPLIGSLFRRHAHSDTRAELLVFITPRIINREESMIHNTGTPKAGATGPTPATR